MKLKLPVFLLSCWFSKYREAGYAGAVTALYKTKLLSSSLPPCESHPLVFHAQKNTCNTKPLQVYSKEARQKLHCSIC